MTSQSFDSDEHRLGIFLGKKTIMSAQQSTSSDASCLLPRQVQPFDDRLNNGSNRLHGIPCRMHTIPLLLCFVHCKEHLDLACLHYCVSALKVAPENAVFLNWKGKKQHNLY
jgi:hypothetical protein